VTHQMLPLTYYGNPLLRKKCAPIEEITPEIIALAHRMVETMDLSRGIAAPQIGHGIRLFVLRFYVEGPNGEQQVTPPFFYINPRILEVSKETLIDSEGCLSIPKLHGEVERPQKIIVEATGLDGKLFTQEIEGYNARIVLHENDHINGVLFIDRMDPHERKKLEPALRALKKQYAE
jgi:peptide deformylase